jgi:peptidyl-prolyl cis-trans isomerase SurA
MRHILLTLLVVGIAASLPAIAGADKDTKKNSVVEEIVARVNNHIITRSEYQRSQEQVRQEAQQQNVSTKEINDRQKDVLRDLIDQQLLIEKGTDMGLSADSELVKRLDQIRKQMNLENMEDLEKAAQAQGVSYEEFKQNLRNSIITQRVIQQEVGSHIGITQEEIKKYYDDHKDEMNQPEQVRLSEILVSTAPKKPANSPAEPKDAGAEQDNEAQRLAEAETKANQLLEQIHKGAKFEDVAKKNSDGPTAAQGGDLGYFKRGALAKELEDTTFALKSAEVSKVIRTKQGFVILRVTEHTQAGVPPLKTMEPKIQDAIYFRKLQPALRTYLTKLRENAYIDIPKPEYVDSGASPNETKPIFTAASTEGPKKAKKKKKLLLF